MDLSHTLTDRQKICTQVWCGAKPETYLWNFFYPTYRKHGRGKTSNFAKLLLTHRQSKAHNFKTAQHISTKQKPCFIFIYNKCTKKRYQTWGHHAMGF